jgi:integrase
MSRTRLAPRASRPRYRVSGAVSVRLPVRKKAATSDIVLSMTGTLGAESLRQLRDRAILLIGFASAMRRSELVALNVADLEWTSEGVMIRISRSKTDQEGLGQSVAVPRGATACPVAALKAWIAAAGIVSGPLFVRIFNKKRQRVTDQRLHGRAIASIVKAGAARLGFDVSSFGAHSLRSGLVTSAVKRGVSLLKICDQTRHKSIEMLRVVGLSIFTFRFHGHHGYAHDLADLGWTIAQQDRRIGRGEFESLAGTDALPCRARSLLSLVLLYTIRYVLYTLICAGQFYLDLTYIEGAFNIIAGQHGDSGGGQPVPLRPITNTIASDMPLAAAGGV